MSNFSILITMFLALTMSSAFLKNMPFSISVLPGTSCAYSKVFCIANSFEVMNFFSLGDDLNKEYAGNTESKVLLSFLKFGLTVLFLLKVGFCS